MEDTHKEKRVIDEGSENDAVIDVDSDSSHSEGCESRPASGIQIGGGGGSCAYCSSLRFKIKLPPFVEKMWDMMGNEEIKSVVSWTSEGTSFVIWEPHPFAAIVLPLYFKHNNFQSFICQLNSYGFKKLTWDRWEYGNEYFRKGGSLLLENIKRRIPAYKRAQHPPPHTGTPVQTSVSGGPSEQASSEIEISLMMENDLLKEEIKKLKENQEILGGKIALLRNKARSNKEKNREILKLASTWINLMQQNEPGNSGLPSLEDEEETSPDENMKEEEKIEDDESGEIQPYKPETNSSDLVSCVAAEGQDAGAGASSMGNGLEFMSEHLPRLEKMMADEKETGKINYTVIPLEDLFGDSPEWTEYLRRMEEGANNQQKSTFQTF